MTTLLLIGFFVFCYCCSRWLIEFQFPYIDQPRRERMIAASRFAAVLFVVAAVAGHLVPGKRAPFLASAWAVGLVLVLLARFSRSSPE